MVRKLSVYSTFYFAAAAFSVLAMPAVHAQEWASVATVSGTLVNGAICDSDGTDIFCDSDNPTLSSGNLTASGYVSATTFYGDGSNLSGVTASTASALVNGTTSITIPTSGGLIAMDTNGTRRVTIDTSGNVGIGTVSPDRALHVKSLDYMPNKLERTSNTQGAGIVTGFYAGNSSSTSADVQYGEMGAIIISNAAGTHDGGLKFSTVKDAVLSEAVRIDEDGYIGVGVSIPANALHIKKTAPQMRLERTDNNNNMSVIFTPQGTVGPSNHSFSLGVPANQDYFSINTYGGAVTSRSIVLTGNGNVGIGTTDPDGLLQIGDNTANTSAMIVLGETEESAETYLPVIHQKNVTAVENGLAVGTRSSGGDIGFYTGATTSGNSLLGTGSNSLRMVIRDDGNVGIGTSSPDKTLHISSPTYTPVKIERNVGTTGSNIYVSFNAGDSSSTEADVQYAEFGAYIADNTAGSQDGGFKWRVVQNGSPTEAVRVEEDGNVCGTDSAFEACSSDARLKKNINNFKPEGVLNDLAKLRPVTFMWNDIGVNEYGYDKDQERPGFIAQEVQDVFPEWVTEDNKGYLTVDDGEMRYMLLKAVQELKTQNDALWARVEALEAASE